MNTREKHIFIVFLMICICTLNARQPLVDDDGIVIQHRGFNDLISSAQSTMTTLEKTNKSFETGMNQILQETQRTIARIPEILTSAEFITRAGIKVVGVTFCIGGAKWIREGTNDLINGYNPIPTKKERRYMSKIKSNQKEKKQKTASTELEDKPLLDIQADQTAPDNIRIRKGFIKLFAGFLSIGAGCLALFRTESIVNFFGSSK